MSSDSETAFGESTELRSHGAEISGEASSALPLVSSAPLEIISAFDYGPLEPEFADKLRQTASRVRRRTTDCLLETGRDLLQIKDGLDHGQWRVWLETECQLGERTAQRMMNAARWAEDKSVTVTDLPPAILYMLSAPSTPTEIADDILSRYSSNDRVGPEAVGEMLRAAKGQTRRLTARASDQPAAPVFERGPLAEAEQGEAQDPVSLSGDAPREEPAQIEAGVTDQNRECALSGFVELVMAHVPPEKWCLLPSFLVTLKNEQIKLLLDRFGRSIDHEKQARANERQKADDR